jgi:hypothetical protein
MVPQNLVGPLKGKNNSALNALRDSCGFKYAKIMAHMHATQPNGTVPRLSSVRTAF